MSGLAAVYAALGLYYVSSFLPLIYKLFLGLVLLWVFSLSFIWTLSYIARGKGDGAAFKKYVKYFLVMYGVNFILGMLFSVVSISSGSSVTPFRVIFLSLEVYFFYIIYTFNGQV